MVLQRCGQNWVSPSIINKRNVKDCYTRMSVNVNSLINYIGRKQYAVANLVEALCYKIEGRGFEFSFTSSFQLQYGPGLDSASNRKEYQG
jgi:hypothetical protein